MKKRLKRNYCFILGVVVGVLLMSVATKINSARNNWYKECDSHYGYTTTYYTCKQYHLMKGE